MLHNATKIRNSPQKIGLARTFHALDELINPHVRMYIPAMRSKCPTIPEPLQHFSFFILTSFLVAIKKNNDYLNFSVIIFFMNFLLTNSKAGFFILIFFGALFQTSFNSRFSKGTFDFVNFQESAMT